MPSMALKLSSTLLSHSLEPPLFQEREMNNNTNLKETLAQLLLRTYRHMDGDFKSSGHFEPTVVRRPGYIFKDIATIASFIFE